MPRAMAPLPADSETPAPINDDVAAILKGLKLDKQFFANRLNAGVLKSLSPMKPGSPGEEPHADGNRRKSRPGTAGQIVSPDVDIYLNEALMPVLAQALDALSRQITKMNALGDKLDNRVRERFNPITWLAQQLLRRHPRAATTPRRMQIYRNFRDWSDYERGRRELLRCKPKIEGVFNGFKIRDSVGKNTLNAVIASIDDKFRLRGALKSNAEIQETVCGADPNEPVSPGAGARRRRSVLGGAGVMFDQFWCDFANAIVKHDVVSFSAIKEGRNLIQREEEEEKIRELVAKAEEERRQRAQEEHKRLLGLYETLYPKLQEDEVLKTIVDEGKILTGDFLKSTDPGFEIEVPPHGMHVVLLENLMILLGFETSASKGDEELTRTKSKKGTTLRSKVKHETKEIPSSPTKKDDKDKKLAKQKTMAEPSKKDVDAAPVEKKQAPSAEEQSGEQHWWTPALRHPWKVLQQLHGVKDANGIVEREILLAVTCPPENFINLKKKVETQFEVQAENGEDEEDPVSIVAAVSNKPSFEQLGKQLKMTRGRLDFFHELFSGFVQQIDPSKECAYPECPASLDKQTMYNMISELQPNITPAEFEARFRRIDTDGSGLIEFDEFVGWMYDDDVAVIGMSVKKLSFEDLAADFEIPLDLVKYIYDCFVNELDEEVVDHYPDKPAAMPYDTMWMLINTLTPSAQKAEFDIAFRQIDVEKTNACTFDEVLEVLDFQALPKELREKYGYAIA